MEVLDRRSVPFTMVTKAVLDDETLKASDKAVYAVLCMYADNKTSECYPQRTTLMKKAGLSDKTLRKCISTLSQRGYIKVEHRTGRKGNASNRYTLLDVT